MRFPYGFDITENCLDCKRRVGRLFCDLPRGTLELLESLGVSTACPKGTILFAEGQSPRRVFVLCAGYVKLSVTSETGNRFCLGIAEPGAVLGLSAVIPRKPHELTAETAEPCQLRIINSDRLLGLLRNDSALGLAAVQYLSDDVQKVHKCVRLLGLSHSAVERLTRLLVQLSKYERTGVGHTALITVPITHRDLALMLGITRETVTRLLAELSRKKLIRRHGSRLLIQDEHGLRVLSSAA
jgi:CRP/FNR family transcriptional regulator, cyclic AMP receptor protein